MNKQAVRQELLWDAVDDWYGLWEAVWLVQTESPELAESEALEEAKSAITSLLDDNLIYLCWFDEDANKELGVMSDQQARKALSRGKSWLPVAKFPEGQIRYAATEKGTNARLRASKLEPGPRSEPDNTASH